MVEGATLIAHDAVAAAAHERENEPPGDESQSQGFWHTHGWRDQEESSRVGLISAALWPHALKLAQQHLRWKLFSFIFV